MSESKRHRHNAGIGPKSYEKHFLIKNACSAQIAILDLKIGGRGVIIDMHAGDGNGAALPQMDMFREATSEASPVLAERLARCCHNPGYADVILCESHPQRRNHLKEQFGTRVHILSNNKNLLNYDFSCYAWGFVINDPCGHSGHAVDVLEFLSVSLPKADFLIVVNEGSLNRHLGLKLPRKEKEGSLVQHAYESKERYAWMLDPQNWRRRLQRRSVVSYAATINNRAFRGRVLIVTNYVAEPLRRGLWSVQ